MPRSFAERYRKKFGDTVDVSITVPPDECSGTEECRKAQTCVEIADTFTFKLRPDGVFPLIAKIHELAEPMMEKTLRTIPKGRKTKAAVADLEMARQMSLGRAVIIHGQEIFNEWAPDNVLEPKLYANDEAAAADGQIVGGRDEDREYLTVFDIWPEHIFALLAKVQKQDAGGQAQAEAFRAHGLGSGNRSPSEGIREVSASGGGDGLRPDGELPVQPEDPHDDATGVPES